MNSEILEHLKSVVNSFNVKDKNNLSKIYFQITGSDYIAKINLENLKYSEDSENSNDSLIIMMDEATFFELKNNIKHPEDLMFDEKIKVKGNLELLK
ncbi:MAG: SCP2 sterol-binding domain-containing protein [Candidatus Actinomarina sp.]|nr:SCP2 sterol-binding domain-containing protein [Actinomycetota bacterium]MBL6832768.1 SCP2 sterol-binding domain-containing protein [Candidatus Actinomarina sp.]MBL6836438.1 SCP2 sterol-binding domain-containing protein [Candidatus Actinomarina sp.]